MGWCFGFFFFFASPPFCGMMSQFVSPSLLQKCRAPGWVGKAPLAQPNMGISPLCNSCEGKRIHKARQILFWSLLTLFECSFPVLGVLLLKRRWGGKAHFLYEWLSRQALNAHWTSLRGVGGGREAFPLKGSWNIWLLSQYHSQPFCVDLRSR